MSAQHPATNVAAIILAAGSSSRMGSRNKLTEVLEGKPLVRHVAEAALASKARPVLVVTGHEAEDVEAALAGLDVTFVHNPAHATGMASSLSAGINALPHGTAAALIMLGDMPLVTADMANRLVMHMAHQPDVAAIVPTLHGQRGNPVLLARKLFGDVAKLSGDEGARRLLLDAGNAVAELALDVPAILTDVDTAEALAALRETRALSARGETCPRPGAALRHSDA